MKPKLRERRPPANAESGQDEPRIEFEHSQLVASAPKGMLEESKTLLVQMQETEFQAQLAFAKRNPRDLNRSAEAMVRMATWNEETAASMHYSVPRGGKMLVGESIRFAEIVKQSWPNCETDAVVLAINKEDKYVVVRGYFIDYETNVRWKEPVTRSIRDKDGNCYKDDMIAITCNAACAIAVRNVILAAVPRPIWQNAADAAKRKAAGGIEGLPKKRQEVLRHFMQAGVAPDRVIATLGVRSEAHLTGEHINSLRGMWTALQNGDATLDELFPPIKAPVPADPPTHDAHGNKRHPGAMPERPRTLHDLGGHEEAREKLLDEARADALTCYHKGVEKCPQRWEVDAGLAAAWQEEWDRVHAEMIAGDDEDTEGADFMNEGESDHGN